MLAHFKQFESTGHMYCIKIIFFVFMKNNTKKVYIYISPTLIKIYTVLGKVAYNIRAKFDTNKVQCLDIIAFT